MDVKEVMKKQNLSTDTYCPNAKDLPVIQGNPKIYIEKGALKSFNSIKEIVISNNTHNRDQEVSFIMHGFEDENGDIRIHSCSFTGQTNDPKDGVGFGDVDTVVKHVVQANRYKDFGTPIMIMGHTHPNIGVTANCWSSGDLLGHAWYSDFLEKSVKMADMLVTPSLDINTMFYSKKQGQEGFYLYEGVYTFDEHSGLYKKENSYGDIKAKGITHERELII